MNESIQGSYEHFGSPMFAFVAIIGPIDISRCQDKEVFCGWRIYIHISCTRKLNFRAFKNNLDYAGDLHVLMSRFFWTVIGWTIVLGVIMVCLELVAFPIFYCMNQKHSRNMYVHHVRFVREWTVLKKTDGSFIEKELTVTTLINRPHDMFSKKRPKGVTNVRS